MESQKIINVLDATSDNVPRFNTKKGSKFMISLEEYTMPTNKQDHECYNQIFVITVMHTLLLKELLLLKEMIMEI